jgi:two-component system chemotaxis response regulator CheB
VHKKVRVLVVDDSPLVRAWIADSLAAQPGLEVVGTAGDGIQAAERNATLRPDVITMDLRMPGADGFAGIARIMAEHPTPILVLTAEPAAPNAFRALSLGALDLLPKPGAPGEEPGYALRLAQRLRLLAGTPVIRHVRGIRETRPAPAPARRKVELLAIAASLGGPRALGRLLKDLPADYPVPIVVVQHMADGFTAGLVRWLGQETGREVREAEDGEPLVAGPILFAPAGRHLQVSRDAVHLDAGPPQHGFRPSATPLFRSVASAFGSRACGVVLTGMGDDGADGLRALRDAGGFTIAQSQESCAVFGMPRAAIEAGAVEQVLPLERIAAMLAEVVA